MRNKFTISVPKPCSADWNKMSVQEKGRFCLTCQTPVIDFESMDDKAIQQFFLHIQGKVCGRFKTDQLKSFNLPNRRRPIFAYLSVWGLTSFIAPLIALSNTPIAVSQSPINYSDNSLLQLDNIIPDLNSVTHLVKGKIYLNKNNNLEPLAGVTVKIKGTDLGTTTIKDGSFEIQVHHTTGKAVLEFSYIGFETLEKQIKLTETQEINLGDIYLKEDTRVLGEVVSQHTFPRGLWYRFKRLFTRF